MACGWTTSGGIEGTRWSSSTLSITRDSQVPPSASSRLRFYFSGSKKGRGKNSSISSTAGLGSPLFPALPMSSYTSFSPSPSRQEFKAVRMSTESGLRRSASRSSTSTASDSGSCDSASSSGLRRKPIPVDLLIKC